MSSMGNVIIKHNDKLLFQSLEQPNRMCNCKNKASIKMDGNCLQKCFVHQPQVDTASSRNYYLGTIEYDLKPDITSNAFHSEIRVT